RWRDAAADYEASLAIQRRLENRHGDGAPLCRLATLELARGDPALALAWCERGLALARERGDRRDEADFLLVLGDVRRAQARWGEAMASYRSSLDACLAVGAY